MGNYNEDDITVIYKVQKNHCVYDCIGSPYNFPKFESVEYIWATCIYI